MNIKDTTSNAENRRLILHCDLNSFFASVELLSHPDLQNAPVAVCGDPASRHGIILAKNEPAKKFGIVTAETIWQAKKKCPDLVLLPPHHELYRAYSKRVNDIYERYTDLVEPFSIDESWLDITGTAHLFGGDAARIADDVRLRIREELGLTVSIGVSFNKIFAKLGSDYKKPDATTVISPSNWKSIVWPLPVENLLFVGETAQNLLHQYGIRTIGQLAACNLNRLESIMGKNGRQLWEYANGLEHDPVHGRNEREPVKSVGNGSTFSKNLTRSEQVRSGLALLSDNVAMRLRAAGLYAGGVQVTMRTPDFKNVSRQKQFPCPTHLMKDILNGSMELMGNIWKAPSPIRMLTVTAIHLSPSDNAFEQVSLFDESAGKRRERQEKLEETMDSIRRRFGVESIQFGSTEENTEEKGHDKS